MTGAEDRAAARRLFLASWILFAAFFATNIQREHYPAMSLAKEGTFRVDAFHPGFHSDIFEYRDGHAYIGNNLGTSVMVAPLLKLAAPLLDALEERERAALAASGPPEYSTEYRNRAELYRRVAERGWTTRFGAVAALTAAGFVAPLSALCVVLLFRFLRRRGVPRPRAAGLGLLFAAGTPLLFRSANLSNNMPVTYAVFGAFLLLAADDDLRTLRRRASAGFLCGLALFCDYAAVVPCVVFGLTVVLRAFAGADRPPPRAGLLRVLVFGGAALPPILALLWTQKICFGDWFVIGQQAMPAVNFTERGWRGFSIPTTEVFGANLFDPRFGLLTYAPVLALGFLPVSGPREARVLDGRAWRLGAAFVLAFLLFCAGNQYSLMQFNTGVRYLMPLVPILFLSACNVLARLPRAALLIVAVPSVVHGVAVAMARDFSGREFHVVRAWEWLLAHGPRLPWLHVLQSTSAGAALPQGAWPHAALFAAVVAAVAWIMRPALRA